MRKRASKQEKKRRRRKKKKKKKKERKKEGEERRRRRGRRKGKKEEEGEEEEGEEEERRRKKKKKEEEEEEEEEERGRKKEERRSSSRRRRNAYRPLEVDNNLLLTNFCAVQFFSSLIKGCGKRKACKGEGRFYLQSFALGEEVDEGRKERAEQTKKRQEPRREHWDQHFQPKGAGRPCQYSGSDSSCQGDDPPMHAELREQLNSFEKLQKRTLIWGT
jgi:hypothetical protein